MRLSMRRGTSNGRSFTVTALVLVFAVTFVSPTFAAAPPDDEVRTLWQENRMAEQLARLNLTPDQVEAFKVAVNDLKSVGEGIHARVAPLLEERRDALLKGAAETVESVEEELRTMMKEAHDVGLSALNDFMDGLTERQEQIVRQLLGPIAAGVTPFGGPNASMNVERRGAAEMQQRMHEAAQQRRKALHEAMPEAMFKRDRAQHLRGPHAVAPSWGERRGPAMRLHGGAGIQDLDTLLSLLEKMSE